MILLSIGAMANATAEASSAGGYFETVFLPNIVERIKDMVYAPSTNHDMLWIVFPLVFTLLMMEFYFGRYTREELGWNTAVGNSLVLIFVSIDLFRYLYNHPQALGTLTFLLESPVPTKMLIAMLVFIEGIILLFEDFFHRIPKRIAFFISSPLPVNLTAYVGIAIVYSNIPFDWYTILAALALFFLLLLFFWIVRLAVPIAAVQEPRVGEGRE
ncbi:hypothetical protein HYS48_04060 [Candidatus Woesearchaeota archaeon]|nr:hypothetical protein [Candidatus Woesearchaeota archaeon]